MYEIDEQQLRQWWDVFNPFIGSGITSIVARALGRKYIGFYSDGQAIADGYTDSTRPDGARIVLNNVRGELVWSSITRTWIKQ